MLVCINDYIAAPLTHTKVQIQSFHKHSKTNKGHSNVLTSHCVAIWPKRHMNSELYLINCTNYPFITGATCCHIPFIAA